MDLLKDPKRFARLLRSIGVGVQKKRPLTPIEVATEIEELKKEINGTNSEVAERLHVDPKQILDFLKLLRLPSSIQHTLGYGRIDLGRIPFTTGARISELDSKEDMKILANSVLDEDKVVIKKEEVQQLVNLKKRNPEKSIDECISQILKIRPRITTSYLIVSDLKESIAENLEKKSKQIGKNLNDFALEILAKFFPEQSMEEVIIKDQKYIKIALTEEGYKKFYEYKKTYSINEIANHLFESEGY